MDSVIKHKKIIIQMVQIITVHGNVIGDMNNKEIHVSRKLQNVVIVQCVVLNE